MLSRAKNFLPLLAAANEKLEKELSTNAADSLNIENVEEDEQYIEMVRQVLTEL